MPVKNNIPVVTLSIVQERPSLVNLQQMSINKKNKIYRIKERVSTSDAEHNMKSFYFAKFV